MYSPEQGNHEDTWGWQVWAPSHLGTSRGNSDACAPNSKLETLPRYGPSTQKQGTWVLGSSKNSKYSIGFGNKYMIIRYMDS